MKLRVIDRLLAALAGIILIVLAVIPLADTLFDAGILARLDKIAGFKSASHIIFMVGGGAVLAAVGLACLHLACKRAKRKGFVVQATDAGELSISIKAIQDLVDKCVDKHDEVHVSSTVLDNTRSGLTIGLRVGLATGVNIPLAVSALQKQIKQYVTACTGVDVHEVKVQVDTTSAKAKASIYAVPDTWGELPKLPREEELLPEPAAVEEAPVEEKEEKCLHQRLFGEEEQPAIVPAPPAPPVEKQADPAPAEEPEPETAPVPEQPAELDTLADLTDGEQPAEDQLDDLPEMPEETDESPEDEAAVQDLMALDGAEKCPEEEPQEEAKE